MKKIMKRFIIALVLIFMNFLPVKIMLPIGDTIQTAVAAETYSTWNSATIYNYGNIVSYNGGIWKAQWWTQGQIPGTTGEWGVWKVFKGDEGTITDTKAPTVPTNLKYTLKINDSVSITWSASSDNVGVSGYDIYKDGILIGKTSLTSYTVTNLTANTLFSFIIKAKDVVGNVSSASSELSVTINDTDKDSANKKLIALTFDDGPSETTSLVLDKLQKYNVVGSFFLIGQNVTDTTKSVIQRELSLGCEIDNHSWSHSDMSKMSSDDIINEIQKTSNAIYEKVGVYPKFFRPPYISISNTMYENIDIPFICGMGCNDWDPSVSTQDRVSTVLNNAKDGDIILLHDSWGNTKTVDALGEIIQGLQEKGFTFVTVNQLFEQKGVNSNVEYKLWSNVTN